MTPGLDCPGVIAFIRTMIVVRNNQPRMTYGQEEIAYLAGFFDGEGTIAPYGKPSENVTIQIGQSNPSPLIEFVAYLFLAIRLTTRTFSRQDKEVNIC